MRFFSKVPGSSYVFGDGTKVLFAHGWLDVDEQKFPGKVVSASAQFPNPNAGRPRHEVYTEELKKLCDEGNPLIYTQETVSKLEDVGKEYRTEALKKARSEQEIAREDAAIRAEGRVGVEHGDVNRGSTIMGNVNESTVDAELQKEVLGPKAVGPGASAVEKARAAAAQRLEEKNKGGK